MAEEKTKLEKYIEELKSDVTLNPMNLHDKTLAAPAIKVKWINILHQEQAYLKKLENADKQLLNNACLQNPKKPRFQHEADLLADGRLRTIREAIEEQKETVSTLKDVINIVIAQFGYDVSTCMKMMQLESGIS
jgi:hypothetical protein